MQPNQSNESQRGGGLSNPSEMSVEEHMDFLHATDSEQQTRDIETALGKKIDSAQQIMEQWIDEEINNLSEEDVSKLVEEYLDMKPYEDIEKDVELLNRYGCPRVIQTPRVLVIRDKEKQRKGRQFADFDVLRRDALIAKFLGTRSDNIPIPTRVWNKTTEEPELVIITSTEQQAQRLLGEHKFGPFAVSIVGHPTKNSILGKVFDSTDYIKRKGIEQATRDLEPQGIRKIERLGSKDGLYKVTFNLYTRPTHIFFGKARSPVWEFIQAPLRCFHCQQYGHGAHWKGGCKQKKVCKRCGGEHDNRTQVDRDTKPIYCKRDKHCIHCREPHEVGDKECKAEQHERNLKQFAEREKVPIRVAKEMMQSSMSERIKVHEIRPTEQREDSRLDRMEKMLNKLVRTTESQPAEEHSADLSTKFEKLQEKMEEMQRAYENRMKRMEEEFEHNSKLLQQRLIDQAKEIDRLKDENQTLKSGGTHMETETQLNRISEEVARVREANKTLKEKLDAKDKEVEVGKNVAKALSKEIEQVNAELSLVNPAEREKAKECYEKVYKINERLEKRNSRLEKLIEKQEDQTKFLKTHDTGQASVNKSRETNNKRSLSQNRQAHKTDSTRKSFGEALVSKAND